MDKLKEYVCTHENCTASFKKPNKLKIHERTHTGERPYICDRPECGKAYTCSSHLIRHVKTAHSDVKQRYKCPICFLMLSNLTNFNNHQARIHVNGQKYPYQCKECAQGFYKKSQMNEHIFSHTGVAPYPCSQCEEGFLKRSMLLKHTKKCHTEYRCTECDAILYRWSDLLQHKKMVHKKPKKPYKCDVCHKHFANNMNLMKHKDTHKDVRTVFECPRENCDREYLYKSNLVEHIKVYHDGHRYTCTYPNCGRPLHSKKKLLYHMQLHEKRKSNDNKVKVKKVRAKRKDAGKAKHCAIALLSGLAGVLPKNMEEHVVNDNNVTIENLMEISAA